MSDDEFPPEEEEECELCELAPVKLLCQKAAKGDPKKEEACAAAFDGKSVDEVMDNLTDVLGEDGIEEISDELGRLIDMGKKLGVVPDGKD